jgi:hypothetical protein
MQVELENEQQNDLLIFELIKEFAVLLWKDWRKPMDVVTLQNRQHDNRGDFSLRGICPHCSAPSSFIKVTTMHAEHPGGTVTKFVAALECQNCLKYILAIVRKDHPNQNNYQYDAHFPIGKPNDSVAKEVPEEIAKAFKEALRCRWMDAYQATVLMCRRSLQVSCDMEKAEGNDLYTQIDDLAKNQRITGTLQKMAHRIRLLGKRGAHSDYSDIDASIDVGDADKAITFMRHYLDHVYVLPKQLDEPKEKAAPASSL